MSVDLTASARRRKRVLAAATASVAAGGAVLFIGITGASAAADGVTLCHATGSTTNPYHPVTVSDRSIQNLILGGNGHGTHTGPVFDPNGGKKQPAWGDIIPPFDYGTNPVQHYPGLNWPGGQAIFDANCVVAGLPTDTATVTDSVPPTDPTSSGVAPTDVTSGGIAPTDITSSTVTSSTVTTPAVVVSPVAAASNTAAAPADPPARSAGPIPAAVEAGRHTASRSSLGLGSALILAGGAGFLVAARRRPSSHRS